MTLADQIEALDAKRIHDTGDLHEVGYTVNCERQMERLFWNNLPEILAALRLPIADISLAEIDRYIAKRRASVSNASVNRETALLRRIIGWCQARKYDAPEIDWREVRLKEAAVKTRVLDGDEETRLFAALPDSLRPIVEFALLSGQRKADMPTEQDAIEQMHSAFIRLKELGWKEPEYATRDGPCDVIEIGSTGIHSAEYQGEWPLGTWWLFDGDTWPSRPVLARKATTPTDNPDNPA